MTLISYLSRIHFASDVVDEALRAEIDAGGHRRVVVLCEEANRDGDVAARVFANLPARCDVLAITLAKADEALDDVERALAEVGQGGCDCLIAFGSARAIAHGRSLRQRIAGARYAGYASASRKRLRERDLLPDYIVVPGIDGLPDPCRGAARATAGPWPLGRSAPPSVVICDPSLTLHANEEDYASAYANALGRCLEALARPAFNPPADGLAVEGLRRVVLAGPKPGRGTDRPERVRELMAAALNAALAQSKGPGLIQAFGDEIDNATGRHVDSGTLKRILLPHLSDEPDFVPRGHAGLVREILGIRPGIALTTGLCALLDVLPLARALRDLDISETELDTALRTLYAATDIALPPPARLGAILRESL